jgi:hypothetical protein
VIITVAVTVVLVVMCVVLHTGVFHLLDKHVTHRSWVVWTKVIIGLLGTILAHVLEVGLFAVSYCILARYEVFGRIDGNILHVLQDYFFYSIATYTTLGYGDLVPEGPLRVMSGVEALLGLVLVAWTAAYLFIVVNENR